MEVIATVVGNYPRPEWFKEYLKKVEGLQKEIDVEMDTEVLKRAIGEVIEEQRKAGIELFTDGQLIWHDFIATLAVRLEGFEMNGLVRYFDNNLYYRVPIVKGKVKRVKKILYDFAIAFSIETNIKAVLSCFTLAKLSKNEYYSKFEDFVWDVCDAMKAEVKELIDMGVKYIQFDEPSLLYANKDELELLRDVYKELTNVNAETILMTYFDSAEKIFPDVLDFGFDVIGLDFVEGFDENLKLVEEYNPEKLNVGIVDGRNTKIEDVKELKDRFELVASKTNLKKAYISPNTGLEFLPWIKAYEKMELVAKLKREVVE